MNSNHTAHQIYQQAALRSFLRGDRIAQSFIENSPNYQTNDLEKIYIASTTIKSKKMLIEFVKITAKQLFTALRHKLPLFQYLNPDNISTDLTDDELMFLINEAAYAQPSELLKSQYSNIGFLVAKNIIFNLVGVNATDTLSALFKQKHDELITQNDADNKDQSSQSDRSPVRDFSNPSVPSPNPTETQSTLLSPVPPTADVQLSTESPSYPASFSLDLSDSHLMPNVPENSLIPLLPQTDANQPESHESNSIKSLEPDRQSNSSLANSSTNNIADNCDVYSNQSSSEPHITENTDVLLDLTNKYNDNVIDDGADDARSQVNAENDEQIDNNCYDNDEVIDAYHRLADANCDGDVGRENTANNDDLLSAWSHGSANNGNNYSTNYAVLSEAKSVNSDGDLGSIKSAKSAKSLKKSASRRRTAKRKLVDSEHSLYDNNSAGGAHDYQQNILQLAYVNADHGYPESDDLFPTIENDTAYENHDIPGITALNDQRSFDIAPVVAQNLVNFNDLVANLKNDESDVMSMRKRVFSNAKFNFANSDT